MSAATNPFDMFVENDRADFRWNLKLFVLSLVGTVVMIVLGLVVSDDSTIQKVTAGFGLVLGAFGGAPTWPTVSKLKKRTQALEGCRTLWTALQQVENPSEDDLHELERLNGVLKRLRDRLTESLTE